MYEAVWAYEALFTTIEPVSFDVITLYHLLKKLSLKVFLNNLKSLLKNLNLGQPKKKNQSNQSKKLK